MKNYFLTLMVAFLFITCQKPNEIKITKIEGSPKYENSKILGVDLNLDEELEFSFELENY